MSELAWRILLILLQFRETVHATYLASWTIAQALEIQDGVSYPYEFSWQYPHMPIDYAIRELIDKGLVEDLLDLGSRFRLIVIEKEKGAR
jgi:hypothetical protein